MQQSCKEAVAHPEEETVSEKRSQILIVLILYQNFGKGCQMISRNEGGGFEVVYCLLSVVICLR